MSLPRPMVKICSLREPCHAEMAVAAGADAVGLIFADARRRVTTDQAVEIVAELRRLDEDRRLAVVGVFVDQPADHVNRVADAVGLDVVQLHGREGPTEVALVERPVVKAVRPAPGETAAAILTRIAGYDELLRPPTAYLIDGYSTASAGGTGERADWVVSAELARASTLILAGGLTPGNVGSAIAAVRPFGVDVSSGVESDGRKDRDKVVAFVTAARAAFAEPSHIEVQLQATRS